MAVKFPLKMADGTMVRTLEELREHFDLTTVLAYYDNGKLTKWLENFYYDKEATEVSALDATSDDFAKKLCYILGVDYSESDAGQVDLGDISKRNEHLERLKQYTADDTILAAADRVAFTQEEMEDLLNRGVTEVYLLGDLFVVPEWFEKVAFRCINDAVVKFSKEEELKEAAKQGNTEAQMELDLFQAVELNDAKAQVRLGDRYDSGEGVEQDYEEAVKWYRKAAEQGDARAQRKLGGCYYFGYGVEQNYKEAVKWYRMAAEQGHAEAQRILGNRYYYGQGVEQDYEEAVEWYRKAAEQGDADAQRRLGDCYYNGTGIEQDYEEAVKWYRKAAEQGDADAQCNLGDCYRDGDGVEQDREEAKKWYEKAANQGSSRAELGLQLADFSRMIDDLDDQEDVILDILGGRSDEDDDEGFCEDEDDLEQGNIESLKKAAEQGDADAQYSLGICYYNGDGVEEDEEEAVKWFEMAAEQGLAVAQYDLGVCYYLGYGVEENEEEAAKWFEMAAEQGYETAQEILDTMGDDLHGFIPLIE